MATSATGNRSRVDGATLLELLVGLVIVLTMIGATVIALPRTDARRAELAASRAQALIMLACERAELTGADIGIAVDGHDMIFSEYRAGQWQAIADSPKEALRRRVLDPDVNLEMQVDDPGYESAWLDATGMQAACLAEGGATPFSINLKGPAHQRWSLRSDGSGATQLENLDAH